MKIFTIEVPLAMVIQLAFLEVVELNGSFRNTYLFMLNMVWLSNIPRALMILTIIKKILIKTQPIIIIRVILQVLHRVGIYRDRMFYLA